MNNNGKNINNQNKKVKEKSKKRKIRGRVFKIILIVIIFIALIILILNSGLFRIKKIEVLGNSRLSENKIISATNLNLEENIFKFRKRIVIKSLLENSYIENVKISRKIPSTVVINIEERVPTYMLQFADSYVYINNQGYMLEISNEKIDVPTLIGFITDLSNIKAGNRLDVSDLEKMNIVLKIFETAKTTELSEYITQIDISDAKEYKIVMEDLGKTIYLGDTSNLNSKMLELKEILHKTQNKKGIVYLNIDLNTQKAYFRQSID